MAVPSFARPVQRRMTVMSTQVVMRSCGGGRVSKLSNVAHCFWGARTHKAQSSDRAADAGAAVISLSHFLCSESEWMEWREE